MTPPAPGPFSVDDRIDLVDWDRLKADLAADRFDNGRSATALRRSFEQSAVVAFGWLDGTVASTGRVLSDGACNAYLVDVWTHLPVRGRGHGAAVVEHLLARVPGQHVGLQTDDAVGFYASLAFSEQPVFMSRVVGRWLDNPGNDECPRDPAGGARRSAPGLGG